MSGQSKRGPASVPAQPRKPRARKPAPPHEYRSCRITAAEGSWVVCRTRDCQDERHTTMARLGVIR